ncbi:MAG: redox-regulated ATPase YchF [Chloroflexi bacterium]|nr:redox-regulated ATPase YchF [Chloroflexota bacterium]
MEICIIGLPKSGKTTIFNALTKGKSQIAAYAPSALEPNVGAAKVKEPRLQALETIFKPRKTTFAEIRYVDIALAARSTKKGSSVSGQFLNYLSNANALLHVIRAFEDENIPHVEGSIDPKRDIAIMDLELALSDLIIIERRSERLEPSLKSAKLGERDSLIKEQALLRKIKAGLDSEIPIWQQGLSPEEIRGLANYQFLTAKPMLVVINISEGQLPRAASIETELRSTCRYTDFEVAVLCGKLEMELSQLNDGEAEEFRRELGLAEPALDRIVRLSYQLLGLISFFTTVSSELKAWTIPSGTTALQAAGKIHTDIEKGFIRAEVINFYDLNRYGSIAEAKRQGLLRLEGKNYIVRDGDIITFLFNI